MQESNSQMNNNYMYCIVLFFTPHAQRERGKVIGSVHLLYYMFVVEKNI